MTGASTDGDCAVEAEAPPVLHDQPPDAPRATRLPGTGPVAPDEWILRCAVFAEQMALRDRLVDVPGTLALRPEARDAAAELLDAVLERVAADPGYASGDPERDDGSAPSGPVVRRPDGVDVPVDRGRPMATLARLVQEDLCILQPGPDGHVLTAGALLFPSFWRLEEKLGRSLVSIHHPVGEYDADVARRVQRLFDAIRPGRPLCRWNWLHYDAPWLHQPRDEEDRRTAGPEAPWLRRERQCLLRLPRTGAVVFTIHTFVVPAPNGGPPAEG